jgi:hypothetical protein
MEISTLENLEKEELKEKENTSVHLMEILMRVNGTKAENMASECGRMKMENHMSDNGRIARPMDLGFMFMQMPADMKVNGSIRLSTEKVLSSLVTVIFILGITSEGYNMDSER